MVVSGLAQDGIPQDLIDKLINTEHSFAYNPIDDTPAELIKTDAFNAEQTLKHILLTSTNEELRTCYALRIVNHNIRRIEEMIRNNTPTSMPLPEALQGPMAQREILVQYLRSIQNKKAEQGGPGYPPQGVGSPDP